MYIFWNGHLYHFVSVLHLTNKKHVLQPSLSYSPPYSSGIFLLIPLFPRLFPKPVSSIRHLIPPTLRIRLQSLNHLPPPRPPLLPPLILFPPPHNPPLP